MAGLGGNRRTGRVTGAPALAHNEVSALLVEYHFGRLSPQRAAAVEAHVRACPICRSQGLSRAAVERRKVERRLRNVRPAKKRGLSPVGRALLLLLALALIGLLALLVVTRGVALPMPLPLRQ